MKLNTNLIIGAALLGGGAYYAFKKGLFGKKSPKETPQEAIKQNQAAIDQVAVDQAKKQALANVAIKTAQTIQQANSITNPKSFKGKVAYIQKELGIAVDGDAGRNADSQTNKTYNSVYGLDKGLISTSNIDYYKSKVEKKLTLVAVKNQQKQVTQAKNQVVADAKKFLDLINNKGMTARLLENVTANKYQIDRVKNAYVDLKSPRKFSKGTKFSKGEFSNQTRGAFVLYKDGSFVFAIDPTKFIVN